MQQVLISLSSFGAAEVRRHGQAWFTRLARQAGADGVEVRGELLVDPGAELRAIAAEMRDWGGALVYSSPLPLWAAGGALDLAAVQRAVDAARQLGAARLKMSIGEFPAAAAAASQGAPSVGGPGARASDIAGAAEGGFRQLAAALEGVELLIENDQTDGAGTVDALQAFFGAAERAGTPLAKTFDMGNWHWTGEDPLQAAAAFAARVGYVHCKGVQRQPGRWVAVPIAESAAPWRAVLRALPRGLPWAIEYPLAGEDLLAVTRSQVELLRAAAARLETGA